MSRFALLLALASVLGTTAPVAVQSAGLAHDVDAVFASSDYTVLLTDVFQMARDDGRLCLDVSQVLVVTSRSPEWFAGVCRREDGFDAFVARPAQNLWAAGLSDDAEEWTRERAERTEVVWHRASVDAEAAQAVGDAWESAIRAAEYGGPGDAIDVDGEVMYVLRAQPCGETMSAHAADPPRTSAAGALRALGVLIADMADGETVSSARIQTAARLVHERLDPNPEP